MKAMILAAGLGTRLQPLTIHTPKPMLKLGGEPLIGHQLRALARAGATDVMINLHHLKEQITDYVGSGDRFGVSVHYSHEEQLLETGGAIRKVLPWFGGHPFWLLNGDIWSNFDFADLPQHIAPHSAHLVLTPTPSHRNHGDFEYHNGAITGRGEAYVYCGIACLHPDIISPSDHPSTFSLRDIFFALIQERRLSAQIHRGEWQDIGTPSQYTELLRKYPNPEG